MTAAILNRRVALINLPTPPQSAVVRAPRYACMESPGAHEWWRLGRKGTVTSHLPKGSYSRFSYVGRSRYSPVGGRWGLAALRSQSWKWARERPVVRRLPSIRFFGQDHCERTNVQWLNTRIASVRGPFKPNAPVIKRPIRGRRGPCLNPANPPARSGLQLIAQGDPSRGDDVCPFPTEPAERRGPAVRTRHRYLSRGGSTVVEPLRTDVCSRHSSLAGEPDERFPLLASAHR